jgi:hypothetical protein
MRRKFNMAFFKRLLLSDDGTVEAELAEPFDILLGEDPRQAVVCQGEQELRYAVEKEQRRRGSERIARNKKRPTGPEMHLPGAETHAFWGVEVLVRQ